jgi:hypothetical protein
MSKKHNSGYVYVIVDESERRKLGFSEDADIRLDILQTGNAELLTVEYRMQVSDMMRAETALHSLFAAGRIRVKSEWFRIQDMDLLKKIFKAVPSTEREEELIKSLGLR